MRFTKTQNSLNIWLNNRKYGTRTYHYQSQVQNREYYKSYLSGHQSINRFQLEGKTNIWTLSEDIPEMPYPARAYSGVGYLALIDRKNFCSRFIIYWHRGMDEVTKITMVQFSLNESSFNKKNANRS